jgi:tellurite resistance protein
MLSSKNYEVPDYVRKHCSEVSNSLTDEQKNCIIAALHLIAKTDGDITFNENKFLNDVCQLFHLNMVFINTDLLMISYSGPSYLLSVLRSLTIPQRNAFIGAADAMLKSDGPVNDEEFDFLEKFMQSLGLTLMEYTMTVFKQETN